MTIPKNDSLSLPPLSPAKIRDALTFTRLAKATKSPEMLRQHLDTIERHLEYVLRNTEEADCDR